jgi:signal transduction histidine kinase
MTTTQLAVLPPIAILGLLSLAVLIGMGIWYFLRQMLDKDSVAEETATEDGYSPEETILHTLPAGRVENTGIPEDRDSPLNSCKASTPLDPVARAEALLRANPDLMFVFDAGGVIVDFSCSKENRSQLYLRPEAFLNQPVSNVLPPDVADLTHRKIADVLDGREPPAARYKLKIDDNWHTFEARYTLCGEGLVLALVRDVTAPQHIEDERARNARFQALLMQMASTYIHLPVAELDGAINQSLAELGQLVNVDRTYLFDYDFETNICRNTHEWCAGGIPPEIQNLQEVPNDSIPDWVEAHRKGQEIYIEDVSALPQNSGLRLILESQGVQSIFSVPLMNDSQCLGFVGFDSVRQKRQYTGTERYLLAFFAQMLVNVRRRRKLEENLEESRLKAEEANRAKSEFLANMSHEIRTPMNGILGMAEILSEANLSPEEKEFTTIIMENGKALLQLIDDILDYSKIQAGALRLKNEPFDIRELIHQVWATLTPLARQSALQMESQVAREVPRFIKGDPARIRQMLINLVGNAIKFTPVGSVTLHLEISSEKFNGPRPETSPRLLFRVRDTGIGIAPEHQQAVFEKFRQVDGSYTRSYGGTGLGLAICQQLVSTMGGDIGVRSPLDPEVPFISKTVLPSMNDSPRPGPGSEFWFTLPQQDIEDYLQNARAQKIA